jgi:hypothetical protein
MLNLGQIYEAKQRVEEACDLYEQIVELGDQVPPERQAEAQARFVRTGCR